MKMVGSDLPKGPTRVRREELYKQVWTTPMHRLAANYGITGNGLAKICDRLKIPYPYRGYWAKKAAKKKVVAYRLPDPDKDTPLEIAITPTPTVFKPPKTVSAAEGQTKEAADTLPHIVVPDQLTRPHPIIAKWLADHKERKARARSERDPISRRIIEIGTHDFTPLDERRHRISDALFKALEKQGAKIQEDGRRNLFTTMIRGEKIEFQLRSKLKQIKRQLTAEERRWHFLHDKDWKQELVPTGYLVFTITTYVRERIRTEWLEAEKKPLENSLPEIVSTLFTVAELRAKWTQEQADQAKRDAEQAAIRRVEAEKRKREETRWRRFVELAQQWHEARLIDRFVSEVVKQIGDGEQLIGDKSVSDWIAWAERRAQDANPLKGGASRVFEFVQGTDYRRYDD